MRLSELLEQLDATYGRISCTTRAARKNIISDHLPVKLEAPGRCAFLPGSSLAIQCVVPIRDEMHTALRDVAANYHLRFPRVAGVSFWQPEGTFHLNVAILQRLSKKTVPLERHRQTIEQVAPVLGWLDRQQAYYVRFRGILITPEGSIVAKGYPVSTVPWRIRQRFIERGFEDQQRMFHITIGRILKVLPERDWRSLVRYTEECLGSRRLGLLQVNEAVLVSEQQGFLHTPSCYEVVRRFRLRRNPRSVPEEVANPIHF